MSDFFEMMADMLPLRSAIHNKDNQLYKVLDKSMGEYMDNVALDFNNLFLDTATGGWLDAFGKDYGVPRKLGESDDDYRNRIIFEKLEYLTASNLQEIYGLTLYAYVTRFDAHRNKLTSDNPYTSNRYMALNDDDLKAILSKKFILGDSIKWIIEGEEFDYIIDVNGHDILDNYQYIYSLSNLESYFQVNNNLKEVKLNLPSATNCNWMLANCASLTNVNLSLLSAINCYGMFWDSNLRNVKLNLPSLTQYGFIFGMNEVPYSICSNLETIEVTIPNKLVTEFKNYVLGLNLQNLTSLIINGEEYVN